MSERTAITDVGREQIGKFLANYPSWVGSNYELFSHTKWGEGGWKEVNGVDVPRDPQAVIDDNESGGSFDDLDVIERPSLYGNFDFDSQLFEVDLSTEIEYVGTNEALFEVTFKLESGEANDDGGGNNPRLFEVAMYDNAGDISGVPDGGSEAGHNIILYATFDGFDKTSNKVVEMNAQIPFHP